MALQKTLVFVKPDVTARPDADGVVEDIKKILEESGLKILKEKKGSAPRDFWEKHYAVHKGKPFYGELLEFVASGPVVAMIVEGEDAIRKVRGLAGPTDSNKARQEAPQSIRAKYGTDIQANAIHASDAPETAEFELELWQKEFFD